MYNFAYAGGVFVEHFSGAISESKKIKLKINESDTVGDLKIMIHNQEGITTDNKVLRSEKGEQLQDDRFLLSYYDIEDESILCLKGKKESSCKCLAEIPT